MPSKPKILGKGAVGKCRARFVYPNELIRKIYPHMNNKHELTGLIVLRLEMKIIYKVKTICIIFHSTEIKDHNDECIELYCSKRFFHVICEGNPEDYFTEDDYPDDDDEVGFENEPISDEIFEMMERKIIDEHVINVVKTIMVVDDHNIPLPENIPDNINDDDSIDDVDECEYNTEWGYNSICPRRMNNIIDVEPVMKSALSLDSSSDDLIGDLFEIFFPKSYIMDVMIPMMNSKIMKKKNHNEILSYGEFLRFIGLWLLMGTTTHIIKREEFWDTTNDINMFTGAPFRLNDFMSLERFEIILSSLYYTNQNNNNNNNNNNNPFFSIRQLINEYNTNMKNVFTSSWITCIDESIMEWTNQYICPGLMCIPKKILYPFGIKWHTICCGLSGIMFHVEIEENNHNHNNNTSYEEDDDHEHSNHIHGKTVQLLLRLTKSIWYTGKVIILNSNYSILKCLIELRKKGLFTSAMIEKRSNIWPKYIHNGNAIIEHFHNHINDGNNDALYGIMDKQSFHIFGMKLPDSIILLMSTYGTNDCDNTIYPIKRKVGNHMITYQCPEVIANHKKYQDIVIQHDNKRQSSTSLSLDVLWKMNNWSTRVFAYLLSITEINIMYALTYFYKHKTRTSIEFRKRLSDQLIHNKYISQIEKEKEEKEEEKQKEEIETNNHNTNVSTICNHHKLMTLPKYKKFNGEKLIQSNMAYPQFLCTGINCKRRIRTYCICSKGIYRCSECYTIHFINEMKTIKDNKEK